MQSVVPEDSIRRMHSAIEPPDAGMVGSRSSVDQKELTSGVLQPYLGKSGLVESIPVLPILSELMSKSTSSHFVQSVDDGVGGVAGPKSFQWLSFKMRFETQCQRSPCSLTLMYKRLVVKPMPRASCFTWKSC